MTKEEIIQLFKEKLTVRVQVSPHHEFWESEAQTKVHVMLFFDDELISEDNDHA